MTGLVSFSLFGDDPKDMYHRGALINAADWVEQLDDVVCRFYLGETAARAVGADLEAMPGVEVVYVDGPENRSATFWRFLALHDPGYDYYLFRDVDSRLGERERVSILEWLDSPWDFHVMRDHPRHGAVMLAGLWGVRGPYAYKIAKRLPDSLEGDYYQVDQDYLKNNVWRFARRSLLAHVGCQWLFGSPGEVRPFLIARDNWTCFVGEGRYGDNRVLYPEHRLEVLSADRQMAIQKIKLEEASTKNPARLYRQRASRSTRRPRHD